ncbi:right-handed parallel beta-helix repeat-containing protein [candidate division WOR-3 bacterium]|nr:right-handed parallel beta-helix repeat-containing protein [candidate division WOR-3 bacterium]
MNCRRIRSSINYIILGSAIIALCLSRLGATTYYVSLSGNDNWPGTSPDSAWRHIAHAGSLAIAGDSVLVDTGTYLDEHVVIINSGDSANPIVFDGYNGMPMLDGQDMTGVGININSKEYIILRNFKLHEYEYGINVYYCNWVTIENCELADFGERGFTLRSDYCTIRNCKVTDARMHNYNLYHAHYCLVEGCESYAVTTDADFTPDYHYFLNYDAHHNIVKNCVAKNNHPLVDIHHGHGFCMRVACYDNKILDCASYGQGEHFVVGEDGFNNEFINCVAYDDSAWIGINKYTHGLVCRMGAHDNKFINCKSIDVRTGISLWGTGSTEQNNNIYENCIVERGQWALYLYDAFANSIKNCVITNSQWLFLLLEDDSGITNVVKNCIITNIDYAVYGNPIEATVTYCNFWNNGFSTISGTGNIGEDPLFADTANGDFHLKSQYGRWDGVTWVYDDTTSPCIDAGDPADDWSNEPEPNGGRINMGAYGNTTEASMSSEYAIEERNQITKAQFFLLEVFPNPFTQMTEIRYQVPDIQMQDVRNNLSTSLGTGMQDISLKIYDVSGRIVKVFNLTSGLLLPASTISWDGTDENGNKVSSGVYFCRSVAGNYSAMKKLLLVK